ncbi:MAG: hypothetical protein ACJ76B_03370 [Solirubrobacterales bacterium]
MSSPNRAKPGRPLAAFAAALLALLLVATPASARDEQIPFNLGSVQVADLTAGPGGALWYAGRSMAGSPHDEIGRVEPTGEVIRFSLPEREQRFQGIGGIAASPGGSLWFTEPNFSRIGRITPAGEVAEYPSPLYASHPKQIVVAPDGNVWFTDGYYRVDRYDVGTNSFEEFSITGGSDPTGIVVGPDGAIWFAERGMGHIGRISMNGQYTRYEIPPVSHPRQIVVGPDGNLWFTDEEAPRIGRITTAGKVSLFPVPVKGGTDKLVAGPRGLLWYSSGGEIGTISTDGEASPAECLYPRCPLKIAAITPGADGYLWVASENFLGRFLPAIHVSIGRHPSRIKGRYLTVGVRCDGGILDLSCEGALGINGLVPRPGERGGGPMTLQLARSRFSIPGDSSMRIRLRLRGRPFRLLAGRHRIRAWGYTTVGDDGKGPVPLTLRR